MAPVSTTLNSVRNSRLVTVAAALALTSASPVQASGQVVRLASAARESVLAVGLGPQHDVPRPSVRKAAAGERATYEVRLAGRGVGEGSLEVLGEENVRGYKTLHVALQISGGLLFAKVNDRFDSWMDADNLFTRRFVQNQRELRHTRYHEYNFSPEEKTYHQVDNDERGNLGTTEPLDDVSFLFYARTLPLRVGDVDTIPRYFKSGHDVILKVLRKERIEVPAGTFETIVVQPTITNAGGLFGQGGQAEVYFSDDNARTLVMMKSRVPVMGSLSLHLKEFKAAP
jgi:hypothetical protein